MITRQSLLYLRVLAVLLAVFVYAAVSFVARISGFAPESGIFVGVLLGCLSGFVFWRRTKNPGHPWAVGWVDDADPAEMGREALAMAGVDAVERFPDLAAEIAAAMLDESKSDICFRKVFRNRK